MVEGRRLEACTTKGGVFSGEWSRSAFEGSQEPEQSHDSGKVFRGSLSLVVLVGTWVDLRRKVWQMKRSPGRDEGRSHRNFTQIQFWRAMSAWTCMAMLAMVSLGNPVSAQTTGACCFVDGCEQTSSNDCLLSGGSFLGIGTQCSECPSVASGACCMEDGSCSEILQTLCLSGGGVFQGDATLCAQVSCPQPLLGACCLLGGGCSELTQSDCVGVEGVFQGVDSTCVQASCPSVVTGACCLSEGGCANYSQVVCDGISGVFQGEGTDCSGVTCTDPTTGACCGADGSCAVDSEANCTANDGSYRGDGTDCVSDACNLIFGDGFETGDAAAWSG